MKKLLLLSILMASVLSASSQIITARELNVKSKLRLGNNNITSIQTDTNFSSHFRLPTAKSVYDFVNGRSLGGASQTADTIIAKAISTNSILPDRRNEPDYEIVVFGDIQYLTKDFPHVLRATTDWIIANKTTENIKAILSVGDLTGTNTSAEYDTLLANFNRFYSAGIPSLPVIGNHDYQVETPPVRVANRISTMWNSKLGTAYFAGKSYYGGCFDEKTDNYYINVDIGSRKYSYMAMEFYPSDSAIAWAKNVIDSLSDREFIICTHAYINESGVLSTDVSTYGVNHYFSTVADDKANSGEQLWQKLISQHSNISMIFGGHFIFGLPYKYLPDVGRFGNIVRQFFYNQQEENWGGLGYGGGGFILRLKISPSKGTMKVSSYSPWLNQYDSRVSDSINYQSIQMNGDVGMKDLYVKGDLKVDKNLFVKGDTWLEKNLSVIGKTNLNNTLTFNTNGKNRVVVDSAKGEVSIINNNEIAGSTQGVPKIQMNRGGSEYLELTQRFGAGQHGYATPIIRGTAISDSVHKGMNGDMISLTKNFAWRDPITVNPFTIDGNIVAGRFAFRARKGEYNMHQSHDFPASMFYATSGFRTESTTDSVARYNFTVAGNSPVNGFANFFARGAFNSSKEADYYGHFSSYLSWINHVTQPGRYTEFVNHFTATNSKGANGRVGTITGLRLDDMKMNDSVGRGWGVLQLGTNDYNAYLGKSLFGDSTQANVPEGVNVYIEGKLGVSTGTNKSMGTATLASGNITVNTTLVTATSIIIVCYNSPSGTQGFLSAPIGSIVAGTSFVINSSSASDNSTVNWWIIN